MQLKVIGQSATDDTFSYQQYGGPESPAQMLQPNHKHQVQMPPAQSWTSIARTVTLKQATAGSKCRWLAMKTRVNLLCECHRMLFVSFWHRE